MEFENLTASIIEAAMKVHTALGPGLLENVYHACLQYELEKRGLEVRSEVWVPIIYGDLRIDGAFKADLIVNDLVVVELKAVEQILQIHKAQLLSYLKLSQKPVGLLLNFNVVHMREGIFRLSLRRAKAADART